MKFKTFSKFNSTTKTNVVVYKKGCFPDGRPIDDFTVDYMSKNQEELKKSILRRMKYENEGASVIMFDATCRPNTLWVAIEI